jgi:signal transduction histidine kinase
MKKAEADRANLRTQKSLERIKALHDIDVAITSTLDLGAILQVLMEKIDLVLPQAVTTIRLFDKETGELAPVACRNIDENLWRAGHSRKLRGLTKKVLETRLPVPIANIQKLASTEIQNRLAHFGLVSYLGVPLIAKDEILGIIAFYTKDEHEFENEEKDFLVTLSGQVAIAIHNARLYEETKHSASEIAALHTLTLAATQSLDLDLILQEAIRKITQIFNFDAVRVLLFDRSMENLELRAAYQSQPKFRAKVVSFKRGQGLVGKVTESGESLVIEDVLTDPSYTEISHSRNSIKAGARFTAFFPIQTKAKRWGAMVCVGKTPRKLKTNEISLLESMSNQIAIAVENSSLYQQTAAKAAELEKANKAKDEFLGVMSHELRTPLNVIKGYAEITRDDTFGQLNSEQKHALEKIYVHANELSHMIDSILQITAIEADTITIEPSEVNPCDILDELRSDYRIRASKELCIEWEYPARLPVFMSDDEKLKAILQNLLNNALKFTDNGTIKTSARHIPERQVIEFSVSDTGSGIAPDKLPSIFDMFKQADSSATRKHQGVGLGLYIVKKFVHLLGGQISVDSKFGEGSTFVVSFPSNMASRDPIGLAFQNSRRADA